MGQIFVKLELYNPRDSAITAVVTEALVDTGSLFLCLPRHLAELLQLEELDERVVTTADGVSRKVPYVGPVKIVYRNRLCITGALVMGEMALMGAIPIEDMDLVIHPSQLALICNPENPDVPGAFFAR